MTEKLKTERIHCNACGRDTEHAIVHCYRNQEFIDELKDEMGRCYATIDGFFDWRMLECQGCKTVSLSSEQYFSEWADFDNDPRKITYFPPRNTEARVKPHWFDTFVDIPSLQGHFILTAYDQIYGLIESERFLPAMLTCRALLETIAIENGIGDKRTFEEKLRSLRDNGHIRDKQIEHLNKAIYDAGSAAMHRSYNPSAQAVTYVLDAVESLIHSIYIEPIAEAALQAEKPVRK